MELNHSLASFVQEYLIAYLVILRFYKIYNPSVCNLQSI